MFSKILTVAAFVAMASAATTCEDASKDEATCMATTEDGENCSWCTSGAVGNSCLKESDAQGLPASVFKCSYSSYFHLAAATTCEAAAKDEATCLAASEGGESCSYCTSGAVGNSCLKESDAQGLPSSVFKCTYNTYLNFGAPATCEAAAKDKSTCLAATEDGESCAYCTSGAVGDSCMKASDAEGLPSSVFKCDYAATLKAAPTTCEEAAKDKNTCFATTEGGENCAWCTSGAVGNTCMVESDAKGLPESVFKCEYQTATVLTSLLRTRA